MKQLLFLVVFLFLFNQTLAFSQPTIDQNKYTYEDVDINAPVSGDSEEDEEFDFDGFMSFEGDEGHLRFDDFQLPNAYGPNLPNVSAQVFSLMIMSKRCDLESYISVTYPVNLASPKVDDYVKSIFQESYDGALKEALESMDESLKDPETCPSTLASTLIYQSTFKILSTNPNVISIITLMNISAGFNHPQNIGKAINIDIKNLKKINLSDIFPQTEDSLKKLWPYLANQYCKNENSSSILPFFYGQTECPQGGFGPSTPLPDKWNKKEVNFEDLGGNVYLSPEGLNIELSGYQSWSYATGPSRVLIPKDQLLEMGASPAFW
jgi:hypothetical protein